MDSPQSKDSIVGRLVSGFKERTVQLAQSKLGGTVEGLPEEAVLGLVASAVRLGATRLEVRTQGNDLVITHNAKQLSENEVKQLHRGVQSLPELSKAFRLLCGEEKSSLELQFLTETDMLSASFSGFSAPTLAQVDLNDLKLGEMTTRFLLKGKGNYRRVNQAMGNELPEVNLIRKRCFLAPLDLVVAGRNLDRYSRLPESLITGSNFENEHHPALSTLAATPSQGVAADLGHLKGKLRAIQAGVCGIAANAGDSGWFQLVNGIARPLPDLPSATRTWGFISLYDTAQIETLNQDVQLLTHALTNELFSSVRTNAGSKAEESLSFLEQNREVLASAGHTQVEIDRTFLSLRERISPSSDPRVLNNRLELASSLEASGKTEESEKLYKEVLPVWESEALNHFDKYRYEEGAALWQRALSLREKLGTDAGTLADKYLYLAEIGRDQRLGFAEQAFRRSLQFLRACETRDKEREYRVLLGLAQILKKNRILTESLRLAEEAQQCQLEINDGRETKALVPVLRLQAEIHDLMNDYGKSTEFEQKAMLLKFKR